MTNEQILKKAIEKAVNNGKFDAYTYCRASGVSTADFWHDKSWKELVYSKRYFTIIFSHDFAKAFWGDKDIFAYNEDIGIDKTYLPEWKYYLAQMVLEEDKLKYLEKFL